MNESTTSITNGDSKSQKIDLYSQNPDTGKISYGYLALQERDPEREEEKDGKSNSWGSNTIIIATEAAKKDNLDIQLAGYIGKSVVNVLSREAYEKFKNSRMEASRRLEQARKAKEIDGKESREANMDNFEK